jgi:hypothetical protein
LLKGNNNNEKIQDSSLANDTTTTNTPTDTYNFFRQAKYENPHIHTLEARIYLGGAIIGIGLDLLSLSLILTKVLPSEEYLDECPLPLAVFLYGFACMRVLNCLFYNGCTIMFFTICRKATRM